MERAMGPFLATAALYLLPVLVAAARWPWETANQRASASVTAALAALMAAIVWWMDVTSNAETNVWMGSYLIVLPVALGTVVIRGGPFLKMRDDLPTERAIGLARVAWGATGGLSLLMLGAMAIILNRLIASGA